MDDGEMIRLGEVPERSKIIEYYGDPGQKHQNVDFVKNLQKYKSPYPMRLSWNPNKFAKTLVLHKKIGDAVIDALEEILKYGGYKYLKNNNYDLYGGSYNWRKIRGGDRLSTHAYGIAIDINPNLGPYNPNYKDGDGTNQPQFIIDAFEKRGFINLPWDRMHFQACRNPSLK